MCGAFVSKGLTSATLFSSQWSHTLHTTRHTQHSTAQHTGVFVWGGGMEEGVFGCLYQGVWVGGAGQRGVRALHGVMMAFAKHRMCVVCVEGVSSAVASSRHWAGPTSFTNSTQHV